MFIVSLDYFFYYRIQFICFDWEHETKNSTEQKNKLRTRQQHYLLKFTQFPEEFRILIVEQRRGKKMKCWQRYVMVATNQIVSRKFIIIDDFW